MFSTPFRAWSISEFRVSSSSSEMPMRFIMSSTWGRPRSRAHLRQRPSLTVWPFSIREMKTTATFFLQREQSVGCIVYLQKVCDHPLVPTEARAESGVCWEKKERR